LSRTRIFLPLLLALTAATLVFGAPPAAAKRPCWQALFVDYADGRIDKTYPVHCYRDAVKNLGEDQLTYGTAADDINRALEAAIIKLKKEGVPITANTKIPPGPGNPRGGGGGGDGDSSGGAGANNHDESFFDRVLHAIGPTSADSVPLPLLILAGLAMLLLAAAGTSLIARRVQAKRTPPPAPSPAPPNRRP
jgi:hypothetical protein